MRHVYIDPAAAKKRLVTIEGAEAHHIKNVLRLRPGDQLKLFDGTGNEYLAVISSIDADNMEVEIQHKLKPDLGAAARVIVAQAFLKEKKMDDLVRKLSELGIAGWIPFFSQRSIARPDKERLAGRDKRWKRIATEALKQCRRKKMLEISDALAFDEVLELSKPCDLKIVFWENEAAPLTQDIGTKTGIPLKSIMVMLGPEGGFTEQEIEAARQNGFVTAGLGPRILRAETATLAASTLVQYLFGDMGP
ncbi:16S rRNA (uracil(1498)-N(3))-methyltransferase (EC [Olavius sp. associated proteobacterium Delta 1]|nr:16S rRNA (uracil(1498)-N(3))-methyltransferase (EC [Olavius sp. associated proteobacterium Delta 1]